MLKLRLKRPVLSLFWSLPLIAVLAHDIYISQTTGEGFHFSEIGYLIQHYTPYHDKIAFAVDSEIYRKGLGFLFTTKAVIAGAILSAISILILNRRPHREATPAFGRVRR